MNAVKASVPRSLSRAPRAFSAAGAKLDPSSDTGHYESWFLRANHVSRPLALWVRYTLFRSKTISDDAYGELFAIWFDGELGHHRAARQRVPLGSCTLDSQLLDVAMGTARLEAHRASGSIEGDSGSRIRWDLDIAASNHTPLLLLPDSLYEGPFPRAKMLVLIPQCEVSGTIVINDERILLDRFRGSVNHNWGSQHTDRYAWGQVAAFDDMPHLFLECGTGSIRLGPFMTPAMTLAAARLGDETLALSSLSRGLLAKSEVRPGFWRFETAPGNLQIAATFSAPMSAFVGLDYRNPPGGSKVCLNTKIASCEVEIRRSGKRPIVAKSACAAAFELITDDRHHFVEVLYG